MSDGQHQDPKNDREPARLPDGEEEVVTKPEGQGFADPVSGHSGKVDFTGVPRKSVEWTGLCMLYLRACESRVPHPILGDHFAAQDVARIDYDFRRIHRYVRPATNQFMVALRSAQFDAWTTDYLNGHPDTVVLHLGCGLHSRAFRIAVPEGVRWFDVDLPQVIALRRRLYSESGTYRMIGSSVTDPGWLDELPAGGSVLIVAEGLLMYLTAAEVTELLHRLLDRFDTGELQADLLSKLGPRLSKVTSGIIKWGTRDGGEITRWDARLRLIEDSPVLAGFDKISLTPQRLLYRIAYAIPANRNYDRLFRYAF
jgi:O-methyltransferase involved in polyketide biosynthesis